VVLFAVLAGSGRGSALLAQVAPVPPQTPGATWHRATSPDPPADAAAASALIRAVLALGEVERATALLGRYGRLLDAADRMDLAAAIAAANGQWHVAAQAYATAAVMLTGPRRGELDARAALAFEQAEVPDSAREAWGRARSALPAIADWLALREARLTLAPAAAESLLALAPAEAWALVLEVRARHRLLEGDPATAEALLDAAGLSGQAAESALARGDTASALRYLAGAVRSDDTAEVRRGVVLLQEYVPPPNASLALAAARGAARLGGTRQAADWGRLAVTLGDSAPATLLLLGGWLESTGRRREALTPYAMAGAAGEVPHARARLRLGDRNAATTLLRYADAHPTAPDAPAAYEAAATALGRDSLLRELARRWPGDRAASRARMRLAFRFLGGRDSTRAEPYLDAEVAQHGGDANRARYLKGRVRLAEGDEPGAREAFTALAAADSLGYYGLLAREAAGLPAPVLAAPPPRVPDSVAVAAITQLALLDSLGLTREADALVTGLVEREWDDTDVMLDVADGLVHIGRANQAIRLGFAASRRLGLRHPRVLRAVFPWPHRDLVIAEAEAFGLDPFLVAGLIRQESWFLPTAKSRAGAVGYMQLMPPTARDIAQRRGLDWSDAMLTVGDANLHVGSAHLAGLMRRYDGDLPQVLAAYNAGGRPVARWQRLRGSSDPVVFVEQITYPETQEYVRSVLRNRDLYRNLYGPTLDVP
jgi:soluble lytic murein transglycosylase